MPGRLQQHARIRLDFAPDITPAKRLTACKTFIRLENAMIRMRHNGGESGRKVAEARASMIDTLLAHLFDHATTRYVQTWGSLPSPISLIALGGYGRGELSPLSDVDIMFLYSAKVKPAVMKPLLEHLTNEILYVLWDCGLKVGHSTRTLDDVLEEARGDIQTKTSLLEARLVAGSTGLFDTFLHAYRNFYLTDDPKGYIATRLADQKSRRANSGNTPFLQEPDIKNGVGGLRDFQNTFWMSQVKLGISRIEDLKAQNYLKANELRDFRRAYDFLLRVRNELHYQDKHSSDVLTLDIQPKVAWNLGYRQKDLLARVEAFMQVYYRSARTIFRISKLVEKRLALSLSPDRGTRLPFLDAIRAKRTLRTKRVDGFIHQGKELAAESKTVFEEDPIRLIRVFRHCQQLGCRPDFNLTNLIRDSLPLISRKVIRSPDANVSFRSILYETGAVARTLNLMHELGVLGRFIPEFDRLTCLVQHEYYHRYTADVHTLNAIAELDRIFSGEDPITRKYRDALHESSDPQLLYVTLLLHDLGKAEGIRGHADAGVKIAQPLLKRLQIEPQGSELVSFVIKNHLVMARFWQTRDVDDPQTAAAFAELVGDTDRLRHLYVHTFCDARGTAASLWNSYKDTLHTSLFNLTLERLHLGDALDLRYRQKKEMIQKELITKQIPGISSEEITAHFNVLPERYFIHTDATEIALHIKMVHQLLQSITAAESVGSLKPVIDWKDDLNRSLTIVNVVTWDRAGLFYKLAGAFSVAGLSILGAKVISRSDHIAIDTFYVVEPGRGIVQNTTAQELFARNVELALVNNKDLFPEIVAQAERVASNRLPQSGDVLPSSFPPTVEVYNELSMQRIIVEVQAYDQIGLLYQLGKTISDHGFDITFARVGTERGVAIDTFYIESANNETLEGDGRLQTLRDALMGVINPHPAETEAGGSGTA